MMEVRQKDKLLIELVPVSRDVDHMAKCQKRRKCAMLGQVKEYEIKYVAIEPHAIRIGGKDKGQPDS